MRTVIAGLVSVAAILVGCLPEDDYIPAGDGGASSSSSGGYGTTSSTSGAPYQSSTSSSSSGYSTTSSSSSSSGAPLPPPPPPPQPLPDGCIKDGAILPAGPAPSEIAGDCFHDGCDGKSKDGVRSFDATDVKKDDSNPCLAYTCTSTGSQVAAAENGKACGTDGGVCFQAKCAKCKPTNATSCATEGGNEPANDQATTATPYQENSPVCGFSNGDDVDWYTFYAEDHALSNDVFDFQVWSTAQTVEVCIFVKCGGGTNAGGCSGSKPGPNGSNGCCWNGSPATLRPHWDMDCAGTSEDSGTAYVSVRTPGGDACEPYLISGHY